MTGQILYIEGWAQDWRKSDGCFSPNLISSPWRRYEDYNIAFCKQWGVVGWCEGTVYFTSLGRPTDIGLQLGKACYPCSG